MFEMKVPLGTNKIKSSIKVHFIMKLYIYLCVCVCMYIYNNNNNLLNENLNGCRHYFLQAYFRW